MSLRCLCRLALSLSLFKIASAHLYEHKEFAHTPLDSRFAEGPLQYDRAVSHLEHDYTKRAVYNLAGNDPGDEAILGQAFLDMQALVNYCSSRSLLWSGDQNDIAAHFNSVRQPAQPGGFPKSSPQVQAIGLYTISVTRAIGGFPDLAESFDTGTHSTNPAIQVYNFEWSALWQRRSLQCDRDIRPKTYYKMLFLGSLLPNETLHAAGASNSRFILFSTVKQITNRILHRHFSNGVILAWNSNIQKTLKILHAGWNIESL